MAALTQEQNAAVKDYIQKSNEIAHKTLRTCMTFVDPAAGIFDMEVLALKKKEIDQTVKGFQGKKFERSNNERQDVYTEFRSSAGNVIPESVEQKHDVKPWYTDHLLENKSPMAETKRTGKTPLRRELEDALDGVERNLSAVLSGQRIARPHGAYSSRTVVDAQTLLADTEKDSDLEKVALELKDSFQQQIAEYAWQIQEYRKLKLGHITNENNELRILPLKRSKQYLTDLEAEQTADVLWQMVAALPHWLQQARRSLLDLEALEDSTTAAAIEDLPRVRQHLLDHLLSGEAGHPA